MADTEAEDWIRPAPIRLAQVAQEARGWDYEDIRKALIACSEAGWTPERIYRETFRLVLRRDATPNDLRLLCRDPTRPGRPLAVVADPAEQAKATAYSHAKADEVRAALAAALNEPEGEAS